MIILFMYEFIKNGKAIRQPQTTVTIYSSEKSSHYLMVDENKHYSVCYMIISLFHILFSQNVNESVLSKSSLTCLLQTQHFRRHLIPQWRNS